MQNKIIRVKDLYIGRLVLDKKTGHLCVVIGMTPNSINIYMRKKTDSGINCSNWYDEKTFSDLFKLTIGFSN